MSDFQVLCKDFSGWWWWGGVGWGWGKVGNKAKLSPASAGAWAELGKMVCTPLSWECHTQGNKFSYIDKWTDKMFEKQEGETPQVPIKGIYGHIFKVGGWGTLGSRAQVAYT